MNYLLSLLVGFTVLAEQPKSATLQIKGFQTVAFGDSLKTLMAKFPQAITPADRKSKRLSFAEIRGWRVAESSAHVLFQFLDDEFTLANVLFPLGSDAKAGATEFERVLKLLKQEYGEPQSLNAHSEVIGGKGRVRRNARWMAANGNFISLSLTGTDQKEELNLLYADRARAEKAEPILAKERAANSQ